mmetsp:Transcript_56501/g.169024  ORF Transcript_56501/g.169024 Transcript_56501/m.169024 type:complete len:218 (-) Transcript_56501:158-811(-)
MNASGSDLLASTPPSAPAIVGGSMTSIRSQLMRGRSASGCRLGAFKIVFATAPPKTQLEDKAIACFGANLSTRMNIGTRIPPPPIPPPAASINPTVAPENPNQSFHCSGNSGSWNTLGSSPSRCRTRVSVSPRRFLLVDSVTSAVVSEARSKSKDTISARIAINGILIFSIILWRKCEATASSGEQDITRRDDMHLRDSSELQYKETSIRQIVSAQE